MTVQRKPYQTSAAYMVLAAILMTTSGCAQIYHVAHYNWVSRTLHEYRRPYFHSGHTGRIIAKDLSHYDQVSEPACFGYESTCWHAWPPECVNCPPPEEILSEEEVVAEPAEPAESVEEVPEQTPDARGGLEGILDLDDPQPGEQPIIRDPGDSGAEPGAQGPGNQGTGAVDPARRPRQRVAPEPKLSIRPVSLRNSIHGEVRESVIAGYAAERSNISVWDTHAVQPDFARRVAGLDDLSEAGFNARDHEPINFVDQPPRVERTEERIEISLVTGAPAPPASAPVVPKTGRSTVPAEVLQSGTSRRTVRFSGGAQANQQNAAEATTAGEPTGATRTHGAAQPAAQDGTSGYNADSANDDEGRPIPTFTIKPTMPAPAQEVARGDRSPLGAETRVRFVSGERTSSSRATPFGDLPKDSSLRFR